MVPRVPPRRDRGNLRGRSRSGTAASSTRSGYQRTPLLLTVAEVAATLRTTPKAVYVMVERGQLPGVIRIARRVLVDRDDLLRWLDQKRTPSLEE